MLFVEVIIYCISTFPFPMNTSYAVLTMKMNKSKDQMAIDNFLSFLAASILQYINASTVMYSNLVTSTAFRSELKKLIRDLLSTTNGTRRRRQTMISTP